MAVLSRDEILARKVHGRTEHVELADGSEVVVRGMTRGEASETSRIEDFEEIEVLALSWAMVEPKLTPDEVRLWRSQDESGEVQKVVTAIQRLSGTGAGEGKEATKSVP